MLDNINENTKIKELYTNKELGVISNYLFTKMTDDVLERTIGYYDNIKCGIIPGLQRICKLYQESKQVVFDIYNTEAVEAENDRKEAKIIHMPGEKDKPFVIVCPGGAYARQWVLVEGYPIAEQLNKMGYTAFILIYRTGQKNLFPKPLDDLAQAVKYIQSHREQFNLSSEDYAVAGFSAGGHLAGEWGTKNVGYKKYGLKKPSALFLGYPSISTDIFYDFIQTGDETHSTTAKLYLERIGGEGFTKEALRKYSVEHHMDEEYPPTYLFHGKEDPVVPIASSYMMDANLDKFHIPHITRIVEHEGHSIGLANGTKGDGWIKEAVRFWENL